MANIKSAKKRIRVASANAESNKSFRSQLKTVIKAAETALDNKAENRKDAVKNAVTIIDRAAGKGILHSNCAARKKSRLVSKLNQAG